MVELRFLHVLYKVWPRAHRDSAIERQCRKQSGRARVDGKTLRPCHVTRCSTEDFGVHKGCCRQRSSVHAASDATMKVSLDGCVLVCWKTSSNHDGLDRVNELSDHRETLQTAEEALAHVPAGLMSPLAKECFARALLPHTISGRAR